MAKSKMKIKAKAKKGVTKVKAMFSNEMADSEEAVRRKIPVEFLTHIIAEYNGKAVWEVSASGFLAQDPLFKFQFNGGKKGDKLVVTTTDNNGKKEVKKQKIK